MGERRDIQIRSAYRHTDKGNFHIPEYMPVCTPLITDWLIKAQAHVSKMRELQHEERTCIKNREFYT